jgi:GNAT superfamily N-acetyltransferase
LTCVLRGDSAPVYRRTQVNVLASRAMDPEGCFVAEDGGRVVGFIFSRTWGGVGWFGTFAVLPEFQDRGIGQQLVAASLAYLDRDPVRLIGLETMAESAYNLGLYLKLGFRATFPSFRLVKALDQPAAAGTGLSSWSAAGPGMRERWLSDLREATDRILPGLDYAKEIRSAAGHGYGETLVLLDGEAAVGLSTLRLVSAWEGQGEELAIVQALALHPAHTEVGTLGALLDGSEALARACGKTTIVVPVSACHAWALDQLLARGYRVSGMMVRMTWREGEGWPPADTTVDFSRWAG